MTRFTIDPPMPHTFNRRQLLALLAAGTATPLLHAAESHPIRFFVPFPPGGSSDLLARAVQPGLATGTGQNVIIENHGGAGGSIGAAEAAKQEPDGNVILMGHLGTLAVNPWIYPRLGYDPLKSFVAIGGVARVPNVLVVNANSPARTLKDLLDLARKNPGRLSFSSGGNGSAAHIAFEALKLRTKTSFVHVPYRGSVPSITDLMGGQVDTTFTGVTALLPHIKSGRLRALAVSSPQRLPGLPDVPTVAESGYPGFQADQWYGIVAPTGTPAARVQTLNADLNRTLQDPAVAKQLGNEGALPMPGTPEAFHALIAAELPRWGEVVKAAGLKAG